MKLSKKRALIVALALMSIAFIGLAFANTFFFHFTQTPYNPTSYNWTNPWTVVQMVDFVEATLNVTGSGYQNTAHSYSLTIKNLNPSANLLTACTYTCIWDNGIANQTLFSGSTLNPVAQNANETYTGTFTPTTYGTGNVRMLLSGITWGVDQAITWTKEIVNPFSGAGLATRNDAITGAARTFVNGTYGFEIESTSPSTHTISFNVKIVETNQTIATVTNYLLTENIWKQFNYTFYSPTGGALTMRLTVTSAS